MGGAAVATMMNAVPFAPGILIDLRGAVLCLSGLFGGPVAVVVTLAFAVTYRLIVAAPGHRSVSRRSRSARHWVWAAG